MLEAPERGWLAGTRAGRVLLSALLVAIVGSVVVWNLPEDSDVRADAIPTIRPLINVLGLNQRWELFSPNPSRSSVAVFAIVTFADGTTVRYDFPGGEPFVGALREYRWRKFERRLRLDSRRDLWRPTAVWIAGRYDDHDPPVVHVALIRRFAQTPRPGSDDERVWEEFEFFATDITPEGLTP